ncbi:hypothetical protein MP228_007578 [Amoeboaphelidium protococcarum]|nr:hypothetical protein MP228_007578 [Amoeboaphelidium protococcarum]
MQQSLDLYNPEGLRIDGRRGDELRICSLRMGVHQHCDGSALIEMGNTKLFSIVRGPQESSAKDTGDRCRIVCDIKLAPFSSTAMERKRQMKFDKRLEEIASTVSLCFSEVVHTQLFPRSDIVIEIQVVSADGGILSAAINATSMALIDAGIPMTDYICSTVAGIVRDQPIVDLNNYEESASYDVPRLTVAILPHKIERGSGMPRVVLLTAESRIHINKFRQINQLAIEGAMKMRPLMDHIVKKRVLERFNGSSGGIRREDSPSMEVDSS